MNTTTDSSDTRNDSSITTAVCFTDGSSRGNPGPGGWAAIVAFGERVVELGGREVLTTNNRMELEAIVVAIDTAASMGASKIIIATDSSYAMKGATAWMRGWKANGWKTKTKDDVANVDVWKRMDEVLARAEVSFELVGGHVGTPGNERCDEIATGFADDSAVSLYDGSLELYPVSIVSMGQPVTTTVDAHVERKAKSKSGSRSGTAYSYVSMVDGVIETHQTWAQCEARVKGVRARFKKALSASDEAEIIAAFRAGK